MNDHDMNEEAVRPPEEYDLSLAEASALVGWDEVTLTQWVMFGQPIYGLLPALETSHGLRFRARELIAYFVPGVNVSPEWIEALRVSFVRDAALLHKLHADQDDVEKGTTS